MPYEAIYPATGQLFNVKWFLERGLSQGRCDICERMMTIRGDKTLNEEPHFWHGSSPSKCPTTLKNHFRYDHLPASATNDAAGKVLKEQVKNNLHTVYLACQAIIDGPVKKTDFLNAIKRANQINVWSYSYLSLGFVPYIILCFIDTHEQTLWEQGKKISISTHFILDPNIGSLDDLWNKTGSVKQFIWQLDKKGNVLKKMPIIPDLNIVPAYFKKWISEVFPEKKD